MKTDLVHSTSRGVSYGLISGFIGALVLGGIASMMPVNGVPFFVAAAMLMGVGGSMATAAGWIMHLITGLIIGAIFGVVVTKVNKLKTPNIGRGLVLGAVAGIIAWIVFFVPLASMLASSMHMSLMSLGTSMIVGSFVGHIIFGLILGGVVGATLPRSGSKKYVCNSCSASFSSQEELMNHAKMHATPKQQAFKCNTCGASFNSQQELMNHAKKAHPMPVQ